MKLSADIATVIRKVSSSMEEDIWRPAGMESASDAAEAKAKAKNSPSVIGGRNHRHLPSSKTAAIVAAALLASPSLLAPRPVEAYSSSILPSSGRRLLVASVAAAALSASPTSESGSDEEGICSDVPDGCVCYDPNANPPMETLQAQCDGSDEITDSSDSDKIDCCYAGGVFEECYDARGMICSEACFGYASCYAFEGTAMAKSCHGEGSCAYFNGQAMEESCWGEGSCESFEGKAMARSCQGYESCYLFEGKAMAGSCRGFGSCRYMVGDVYEGGCANEDGNADFACAHSTVDIPAGECTAPCACYGRTEPFVSEENCNEPCACANRNDFSFFFYCVGVGYGGACDI